MMRGAARRNAMAGKNVLIAIGSPRRNGNSTALAQEAATGVRETGGTARVFRLHDLAIRPCRACDNCQKNRNFACVQVDDMNAIYAELAQADALLIASPVYWFTISAQTKLFVDRLYAFIGPDGHGLAGKRIGIILTYGDVDVMRSGAVNALRTFQDACRYVGAPIVGEVYGSGSAPGEVKENLALMREAYELGQKLAAE
jgi:multimeric flavodoxin WrbA